jgi:hypothetical protein
MMKNIFYNSNLFLIISLLFLSSCETFDLNQTQDPNAIALENLEYELAFNYVQLQLPVFVNSANSFTQRVTRQMAMTGGNTYDNAFQPVDFDGNWRIAYNILNAIKFMEPKAAARDDKYVIGASRVIRCYILATLVDMYGDIPYTEALLGNQNFFPKFDKSADVYKGVLAELEQAKAILQDAGSPKSQSVVDLYYGVPDDWIRLANTIRFKMLVTARLAGNDIGIANVGAEIQTILDSGNYITQTSQDFEFQYATSRLTPQSRHPQYYNMYETGGGSYICNYMFWTMTTEKGFDPTISGLNPAASAEYDPRTGFYFYKQVNPSAVIDEFNLPGRTRPDHYDFNQYDSFFDGGNACFGLSNWITGIEPATGGYWGRDHGNNNGIPPDNEFRTVTGLYPIGGEIGDPGITQTGGTKGAKGKGVMPIILASYVKFLKAEAMLKLNGVTGNPQQELKDAISVSIDKTINFIPDYVRPATVILPTLLGQKQKYLDFIDNKYSSLSSNDEKLELVIKEYFIASWGNGIEPYNNYRRTGYPSNFQPTLEPISGTFFYTALYPLSSQQNNPNTPPNTRSKRVFWDANLNLH